MMFELRVSSNDVEIIQNFKHLKEEFIKIKYPDWNIQKITMWVGFIEYDGYIFNILYEPKSEDQLFRERFDFLFKNISIQEGSKNVPYGYCQECERKIQGWKPMFGGLAPEWWATMREHGIDPSTGHSSSCTNKKLRIE